MKHDSDDQITKIKETQETEVVDIDLQVDDIDGEIIDLLDSIEEDDSGPEEALPSEEAAAEATDEEQELLLEDLDLDDGLGPEEFSSDAPIEPIEDDQKYEPEVLEGAEGEPEETFTGEEAISGTPAAEAEESGARGDPISDEVLAELFSSHEMEVAEIFQEATESSSETDETGGGALPATEGESPKDMFADLGVESEVVTEETSAAAEPPVAKEELPEDIFADLEVESEGVPGQTSAAAEPPVAEEELPEDVFADLETDSEDAAEEAVTLKKPVATEQKVPEEILVDLEAEPEEMIAVAASPAEIEAGEAVSPAAAEELAALLSAQVDEVVTRLVEERLPSMVERAIAEEIEKIRTALESGK